MSTYEETAAAIDQLSSTALDIKTERDRYRTALEFIAAMDGMTLIAPSLGPDGDHGHQIGANKAFGQCADAAKTALTSTMGEKP